jgi:hypothetical protein
MSHPSLKRLDYHQAPKGNFLRQRSNCDVFPANTRLENAVAKRIVHATLAIKHPVLCAAAHTFARPENMPGHMSVLAADGRHALLTGSDFDRHRAVLTRKAVLDQLGGDKTPLVGNAPAMPTVSSHSDLPAC